MKSIAISANGISASIGNRSILQGIDLQLPAGRWTSIVGPNGAGKSTLLNLILGEESPDEGTIEWDRGAAFGFLPQESAPVGDETILQIATSGKKLAPENDDDWDID